MDKIQEKAQEIKDSLATAIKDIATQKAKNDEIATQVELRFKAIEESTKSNLTVDQVEELKNEISDLRSKYRNPVAVVKEDQKENIRAFALKSINEFVLKSAPVNGVGDAHNSQNLSSFIGNAMAEGVKTLALAGANDGTGTGAAATAVQEVLAMDLIEYGRDLSPILGQIGMRSGLTRDYRELVLSKYPSMADGLENVAGVDFPKTSTQEYGQVKSDVIKIMANAPITDEAFYGTTYNVYSDLIRLLGDQFGVNLSNKVLYGDGGDKNGRGLLGSKRIDITQGTGESFKKTMATDTANSRSPEYFPVLPTGVAGSLGTSDKAKIQLILAAKRMLPQKYRAAAKFHMTEDTYGVFEEVVDTTGRPLLTNSYMDMSEDRLRGKPVIFDETLPQIADGAPCIIYGDLSRAFAMANGDIDYMQINTMKTQGVRYVEHNKEMFTIMQASDAVVIIVATANTGS